MCVDQTAEQWIVDPVCQKGVDEKKKERGRGNPGQHSRQKTA